MKRDFHTGFRQERRSGEQRGGTCIALIDGRFLIWLAQQGAVGTTGESVNRQGLLSLLAQALSQSGLDVDLRRIYWYTDRSDGLEELRLAQQSLGEITGEFTADDLLGVIFSRFCIGK